MPTAAIISLATGGPPAPPEVIVYTGLSGSDKLRNTTRAIKRNSTRLTTTRRKTKGCC
jgi:hypothetical protein